MSCIILRLTSVDEISLFKQACWIHFSFITSLNAHLSLNQFLREREREREREGERERERERER